VSSGRAGGQTRFLRRLAIPGLGLAISLAAIYMALRGIDLSRTAALLGGVQLGPLGLVALALLLQLGIRALRWTLLLPDDQTGRVRVRRVVPVVLVGYLGNAVLPARLGDPIRAVLVGQREPINVSSALGSVVLERAVDTLTLAVVAAPAAAIAGAPDWFVRAAVLVVALSGFLIVAAQTPWPSRAIGWLAYRLGERWLSWLGRGDRFVQAMDRRGHGRALVAAGILSVAVWLLDGAIYWACARALGIDMSPIGAMFISGITVLGTAIPSAPGYVGTFELAASSAAQAMGVVPDAALGLAILAHAVTVVPLALGGAVSLAWIGSGLSGLIDAARASVGPGTDSRRMPAEAQVQ
jgi:glycosyltransferase 2 family protein